MDILFVILFSLGNIVLLLLFFFLICYGYSFYYGIKNKINKLLKIKLNKNENKKN